MSEKHTPSIRRYNDDGECLCCKAAAEESQAMGKKIIEQQAEIDRLTAEQAEQAEIDQLTAKLRACESVLSDSQLEEQMARADWDRLNTENTNLTARVERLREVAHRTSNIIQAAIKGFGDYVPLGIAGDKLTAMFTTCRNAAYDLRAILAETEVKP